MPDQGRPGSLAHRLSASKRILAVEDEGDIAEFLRAYFRASGYDLLHLDPTTPEAVLDAIDELKPDLILLDYRLRGFSGDDAYRLIRAEERFACVPVIVVTGDASAQAKLADKATGIDGYVAKPFNVNTLAGIVAERLEAARVAPRAANDEGIAMMTPADVTDRLTEEIEGAGAGRSVSFALVQLLTRGSIRSAAGDDGVTYVVRELIHIARQHLPAATVVGRTDSGELALVVPGMPAKLLEPALTAALAAVPAEIGMPGGAMVKVAVVAGLASFPEHAESVDELYMAADAALADAVDAKSSLCIAI
jgi:DNA-binding response OmpR family regulator